MIADFHGVLSFQGAVPVQKSSASTGLETPGDAGEPFLNGWVVGVCHALTSLWNSLRGPASPEAPASRRELQQDQGRPRWRGGTRVKAPNLVAGQLREHLFDRVIEDVARTEHDFAVPILGGVRFCNLLSGAWP